MAAPHVPRSAGIATTSGADLLRAAIQVAAGGSVPRFAAVLGLHHSQVYRWLDARRAVPDWLTRVCRAILADPTHVVAALTADPPA